MEHQVANRYNQLLERAMQNFANNNAELILDSKPSAKKDFFVRLKNQLDKSAVLSAKVSTTEVPMKQAYVVMYQELFVKKQGLIGGKTYLELLDEGDQKKIKQTEQRILKIFNKQLKHFPKVLRNKLKNKVMGRTRLAENFRKAIISAMILLSVLGSTTVYVEQVVAQPYTTEQNRNNKLDLILNRIADKIDTMDAQRIGGIDWSEIQKLVNIGIKEVDTWLKESGAFNERELKKLITATSEEELEANGKRILERTFGDEYKIIVYTGDDATDLQLIVNYVDQEGTVQRTKNNERHLFKGKIIAGYKINEDGVLELFIWQEVDNMDGNPPIKRAIEFQIVKK